MKHTASLLTLGALSFALLPTVSAQSLQTPDTSIPGQPDPIPEICTDLDSKRVDLDPAEFRAAKAQCRAAKTEWRVYKQSLRQQKLIDLLLEQNDLLKTRGNFRAPYLEQQKARSTRRSGFLYDNPQVFNPDAYQQFQDEWKQKQRETVEQRRSMTPARERAVGPAARAQTIRNIRSGPTSYKGKSTKQGCRLLSPKDWQACWDTISQ